MSLLLALGLVACAASPPASPPVAPGEPVAPTPEAPPRRAPHPGRVIALGDVHGDLEATLAALRLAALIDAEAHWVGGEAVLVQTGDVLDRGDGEEAILELLARLATEADAAGGRVVRLLGNHELMNVAGDFRYVTPGGFEDFADEPVEEGALAQVRPAARGRVATFAPGGAWALRLAEADGVTEIVGDSVFVHGGVHADHVARGLDAFDAEAMAWLRGDRARPDWVSGDGSLVWTRVWSRGTPDCEALGAVLDRLGVARMVVGHTVQPEGPTSACDGRVWRVDVGMASHYGGRPAVLEITPDGATPLIAR